MRNRINFIPKNLNLALKKVRFCGKINFILYREVVKVKVQNSSEHSIEQINKEVHLA